MSTYYSSERLIESVKRRINMPTNQNTFTDADILEFADEELGLVVVPAIMSLHEDYLLFSEDQEMVADQTEYIIPYRAVGNKLYDLQLVHSNNNILPMSRTTVADQVNYNGFFNYNTAYSYYVKNNRIGLLPAVNGVPTGSLRFVYYIRPSSLVPTNKVCVITDINRDTGLIAVSSLPTTFSTNAPIDFYKVKSPHNILSIDVSPSSVNQVGLVFTFDTDDIPADLDVGDHIALAQQCAIPQIPSDLHVFLAQKTAERILESQGDSEGLQLARQKSAEMEVRAGTIIDNRVDESPIKLANRRGLLQTGLLSRWYRRGR
jgi:hypothetical protein